MTSKKWTLTVDAEGIITFPEDLLKITGWNEDTLLQWDVSSEGVISLTKAEQSDSDTAPPENES